MVKCADQVLHQFWPASFWNKPVFFDVMDKIQTVWMDHDYKTLKMS